jgi:hypothetical protein
MFGAQAMASCVGRWMYHNKTALLLQQIIYVTCLIMCSDFVPALWFRALIAPQFHAQGHNIFCLS